jgi:hypothetical protein
MRDERDGVVVSEWLEAKATAIAAIGIGLLTLIVLPWVTFVSIRHGGRMDWTVWLIMGGLPAAVWIAEVVVFLMVINNTWRRTVLEARHDAVLLRFTAPFGDRRYEWGASEVEDIRMESTTAAADRNSLGELEIYLAGLPLVKLFTDHPAVELDALAVRLRHAVGVSKRIV